MPDGNNLHRVVIFRDAGDKTSQILPFSMYDSVDPEDLWDYLARYEKKTSGQVLAIPHNGNLSNGLMFDVETYTTKKPIDKAYAEWITEEFIKLGRMSETDEPTTEEQKAEAARKKAEAAKAKAEAAKAKADADAKAKPAAEGQAAGEGES